jgi:hypothetical protein
VTIVDGDVLDNPTMTAAIEGQAVVYASLAGAINQQAECIVKAMYVARVKRLSSR